jgi:hypothetical protein
VSATGIRIDARRALLAGLIDHAPLFPPASLPLGGALAADRAAAAGADAALLGRLVWPASRLGELPPGERAVSVVLDVAPGDFVAQSHKVEALELPPTLDPVSVPDAPEVYWEAPADDLELGVTECRDLGIRSKIRCGGAAKPSVESLAFFVRRCRELGVPFKATGGLHHALPTGGEHGLVNVLAAAVFGDEERALADDDREAFRLDDHAFAWRDRRAPAAEIARVRRTLLVSVGSCSFDEPVGELRALGFA